RLSPLPEHQAAYGCCGAGQEDTATNVCGAVAVEIGVEHSSPTFLCKDQGTPGEGARPWEHRCTCCRAGWDAGQRSSGDRLRPGRRLAVAPPWSPVPGERPWPC